MKKILCTIIFTFYCLITFAQPNGYAHNNDTTTFIFNEKDYNVVVKNKVVVTGAFRNWSQDMVAEYQMDNEKTGWQYLDFKSL